MYFLCSRSSLAYPEPEEYQVPAVCVVSVSSALLVSYMFEVASLYSIMLPSLSQCEPLFERVSVNTLKYIKQQL